MRKIYLVVLVIVILLLVGASLRIAIPKNPNYNYITLNVSATVGNKSSSGLEVTFYVNATGGTHSFFINSYSSCLSIKPYGFGLLFENATSACTAKFLGCLNLKHPLSYFYNVTYNAKTPGFNISESHTNMVEQVTFHHLKPGYYFYSIGNLSISGNRRTYMTINYLDAKSTFNILNLTLPDKT